MKIVVVGAGVSGLTCTVALLEAGAEVAVLTAAARPRTASASCRTAAACCSAGSGGTAGMS